MKSKTIAVMLPLTAALLLLAGCNAVSVTTKQYWGVQGYPPTDPAGVQILREAPPQIVERLGELYADPTGNPSVEQIERNLRYAASRMGANAVVIVGDGTELMGAVKTGPWYDRQISADYQKVVVGVAVRFIR